jgi:hypothetical protein
MSVIDNSVTRLKSYKFSGLSNMNSLVQSRRDSYYVTTSFDINPERRDPSHI